MRSVFDDLPDQQLQQILKICQRYGSAVTGGILLAKATTRGLFEGNKRKESAVLLRGSQVRSLCCSVPPNAVGFLGRPPLTTRATVTITFPVQHAQAPSRCGAFPGLATPWNPSRRCRGRLRRGSVRVGATPIPPRKWRSICGPPLRRCTKSKPGRRTRAAPTQDARNRLTESADLRRKTTLLLLPILKVFIMNLYAASRCHRHHEKREEAPTGRRCKSIWIVRRHNKVGGWSKPGCTPSYGEWRYRPGP